MSEPTWFWLSLVISPAFAAFPVGVSDAQPANPSFDCRKAQFPDEHVICGDSRLAELDQAVSIAYRQVELKTGRGPGNSKRYSCRTACVRQRPPLHIGSASQCNIDLCGPWIPGPDTTLGRNYPVW